MAGVDLAALMNKRVPKAKAKAKGVQKPVKKTGMKKPAASSAASSRLSPLKRPAVARRHEPANEDRVESLGLRPDRVQNEKRSFHDLYKIFKIYIWVFGVHVYIYSVFYKWFGF